MKLLALKIISEFRNLEGLNLRFDSTNDTYVIIGNNGTGKTNILEALSSVFSTLLSHSTDFMFSFVLRYEVNDITYRVKHDKATSTTEYQKDDVVVTDVDMIYPNRIVCNYSGEDTRMWDNYYKKANEEYLESVRTAEAPNVLSMIYIDRTMWKYILLCMLATRDVNIAFDKFLQEKLGIASGNLDSIDLNFNTAKLSKWRRENQITLFIRQLRALFGDSPSISSNDITKFNPNDDDARLLFNKYMGASQVIDTLNISFNGGIESAFLSEGEKKMMVILFILEAISDEQTLVLMDEPDSHIHISRKSELREMFDHMSHRSNIITSHSPTLTASFEEAYTQNEALLKKISLLADKVEEYRRDEDTIRSALLVAQRTADQVVREAKEKADACLAGAENRAKALEEFMASPENVLKPCSRIKPRLYPLPKSSLPLMPKREPAQMPLSKPTRAALPLVLETDTAPSTTP